MISSRNLSELPDIDQLRRTCQSIAMLDALVAEEVDYRYYFFEHDWLPGVMLASANDGSGDWFYVAFTPAGALIRGFDHETEIISTTFKCRQSGPALWTSVPPEFLPIWMTPASLAGELTFCLWRSFGDTAWQRGAIAFPEGGESGWLRRTPQHSRWQPTHPIGLG